MMLSKIILLLPKIQLHFHKSLTFNSKIEATKQCSHLGKAIKRYYHGTFGRCMLFWSNYDFRYSIARTWSKCINMSPQFNYYLFHP